MSESIIESAISRAVDSLPQYMICRTCKDCKFWMKAHGHFGYCQSKKINTGERDSFDEYNGGWNEADLLTGADFGCIHFEQKEPQ